jgi:hypothetical protein
MCAEQKCSAQTWKSSQPHSGPYEEDQDFPCGVERMSPAGLKQLYPRREQFNTLRRQLGPDGMLWTGAIEARFGPGEGGPPPA